MNSDNNALELELTFTRFDRMCAEYPDRTAVVYLGERFSYARLQDMSLRFAGALGGMGVKKGDRVMVYIANCIQWLIAFLGIQKAGAVIVLDAQVVDVYTLTEAPFLGHRYISERFYSYDRDHYFIERSPAGMVTLTTLLWELMPLIRYQTYDVIGDLRDDEGLVEIAAFGEW
jgi:hypothetical protein